MPTKKSIPNSAASAEKKEKRPHAPSFDSANLNPCWRFSNFDKDGPWGLNSLLDFTFYYNTDTYEAVFNSGLQQLDSALDQLKGKEFKDRHDFWKKVKSLCTCDIPALVVDKIEDELVCNAFKEKIYPKLIQFEKITWDEIRQQSHRKGDAKKSNNHNIDIEKLIPEARARLKQLKFDDRDKIYSLRLEGTVRIFGFKELNYLDIIWVDLNHEICPSGKN